VFLYDPQARIHHRIPTHRANWRYFRSRCFAEGLSKAMVARYVGAKDSLSSERIYTSKILPLGVLHGIRDALFRVDPTGLSRAGAIIFGLLITTAGYLVGQGAMNRAPTSQVVSHEEYSVNVKLPTGRDSSRPYIAARNDRA
jgi:hypothetical protein